MLELTPAQRILAYAELVQKLLKTDDQVQSAHGISLLIYSQELLTEACKANLIDHKSLTTLNATMDTIMQALRPQETIKSIVETQPSLLPDLSSSIVRNRSRRTQESETGTEKNVQGNIEKEMLMMAHDMRDAANLMHTTIRKDLQVLSTTADMQDASLSDTKNQNLNARNIRSAKRLGFLLTIVLMVVSLVMFLALVPLILVT